MKVCVISDVHANLPALEAVLDATLEDVDRYVCVGDILGVLGWPQETLTLVRDMCSHAVYGNHDAYQLPEYEWYPVHPSQKQEFRVVNDSLKGCARSWLYDLPEEVYVELDEGDLYMVHGAPWTDEYNPHKCGYPANNYTGKGSYTKVAGHIDASWVALGHTHQQAKLDCSKFGHDTIVFNPGSVGVPFDGLAEYVVLDTGSNTVSLKSTEFDVEKVESKLDELDITEDGDY